MSLDPKTGEVDADDAPGIISADLYRGVMTYTCSCGSQMLRPYRVKKDDIDGEYIMQIVCLNCGASSTDKWKELQPLPEYTLEINGDVDEKVTYASYNSDPIMKRNHGTPDLI